jgi:hypothetical protein
MTYTYSYSEPSNVGHSWSVALVEAEEQWSIAKARLEAAIENEEQRYARFIMASKARREIQDSNGDGPKVMVMYRYRLAKTKWERAYSEMVSCQEQFAFYVQRFKGCLSYERTIEILETLQ